MPLSLVVLLEENVPFGVTAWLRVKAPTIKVSHVLDLGFASYSDETLYEWAEARGAIIVTYDEDFADLRRFPTGRVCGVVRLKVQPTDELTTCVALSRLLESHPLETMRGKLAVVDERRIRLIG